MALPLAGAWADWNKGSLGCFLLAKLSPTFGSFCLALIFALVRSVCNNVCSAFKETFGATVLLQKLLGRIAPASSSRDSASTLRRSMTAASSQLGEALCMLSPRSSSSPSSSQLWAEATSSLYGVCSRDSTFQLLPDARHRPYRRCSDKVRLSAARGDPGEVRREGHPSSIPKAQR